MKYTKILTALGLLILSSPLVAFETDDGDIQPPEGSQNPFILRASTDFIGKSDIDKHYYNGHINFNSSDIVVGSLVYYNKCYSEGAMVEVGYERTHMKWNNNPFFKKSNYNTFTLDGLLFSERAGNWNWKAFARWNFDLDHPEFSHYSTYDMFLWGRYAYCEGVGLHFGFYAETGMKVDRIYPVLGFDWQYSEKFSIHAVFPLDLMLMYMITDRWSTELCFHFFRERHRVGEHEEEPEAIWVYQNWSVDNCITYNWSDLTYFTFHIGYALGGQLTIANKNYDDKEHFDFKGAGLIGGELSIKF